MKILLLNAILYTPEKNIIPKVETIKDCMIYNLGMAFKELGHEVTLVAASDYLPTVNESYDIDVVFLDSQLKKIFQPTLLPLQLELIPYLRKNKNKFDLIISSETFSFLSLFSVLTAKKKTIIWQELNVHNKKFKRIPSLIWYNIITRLFYKNVLTIPRSESAREFISCYTNKVTPEIIDHGVNIHKFKIADKKKKQFIVISQLIARKNVDSIINTFSKFIHNSDFKDFKLLIAGRGDLEEKLKLQVKELGITENVIFLGFLTHDVLSKHVSESQALLVDTIQDLNMVSIPEAIVAGTPVLTNTVPALAGFIQENRLGIAKENWSEKELEKIVSHNEEFVKNCLLFREDLSSLGSAKLFIKLFEEKK